MLSSLREKVGRASDVPAIVDDAFEGGCIHLLTEAYNRLKHAGNYELNWHENMFTARLVVLMEQVRDEVDINLQIDPECYQYFQEVLEGNLNPDRAPRIDIRVMGGWVQRDIYYAMEAKIRKRSLPSETFEVLMLNTVVFSTVKLQKSVGG